ncbi:MAG: GntR family transcriptional regulator [Nocardioides sp.]|nr:GntR family transcriptional regulator [Nocardioides sp.]
MATTTSGSRGGVPRGRDNTPAIREQLRAEILTGTLVPGAEISQARIAADFGVSRGPVREAFRLLESEGLIDARVNHRARVRGLSVHELEHLYSLRVINESLALTVSVPLFSEHELAELDELAEVLRHPGDEPFDFEEWDQVHQGFHERLLAHSGPRMLELADEWAAHTQRYRRAYAEGGRGLPPGAAEHVAMARLCRDRDARGAAHLLARHLSRAALTLIAQIEPTHEPVLLRAAIRQVLGPEGPSRPSEEHRRAGA